MTRRAHIPATALLLLALVSATRADAPQVYAITGARIVTAAGAPLTGGTIVIRNSRIEAVGASVAAPADAQVIDGAGMTVYPGLVDMGRADVADVPAVPEQRT